MKKTLLCILLFFALFTLSACHQKKDIPKENNLPKEYTITYVNFDGNNNDKIVNVEENTTLEMPDIPKNLERKYGGAYRDSTFQLLFEDWNTLVKSNIKVYFKWTDLTFEESMEVFINSMIFETEETKRIWNKEDSRPWNYTDGLMLDTVLNLYNKYKNTEVEKAIVYKSFFLSYVDSHIDSNGKILYENYNIENIYASNAFIEAYKLTSEDKYLVAAEESWQFLLKQPKIELKYMTGYPLEEKNIYIYTTASNTRMNLEDIFMYIKFYIQYALMKNRTDLLDNVIEQYNAVYEYMVNKETRLLYPCYDSTKTAYWANQDTGLSKSYLLRSMGFYIMSLCDAIEYYSGVNRSHLVNRLKYVIDELMKYQDEEMKLFYYIIDEKNNQFRVPSKYFEGLSNEKYLVNGNYVDAEIGNYFEASGNSMIAYAILKACQKNYLNESYISCGKEIFEGVKNQFYRNCNLNQIVLTPRLESDSTSIYDGSVEYYLSIPTTSNDAKGVAPFINAYLIYSSLK